MADNFAAESIDADVIRVENISGVVADGGDCALDFDGIDMPADDDASMTVTIALDDDGTPAAQLFGECRQQKAGQQQQMDFGISVEDEAGEGKKENNNFAIDDFLVIQPPPTPAELLAEWNKSDENNLLALPLHGLPASLIRLLELRLNPPVFGSMRNWEFLAAHFGLSLDEIVGLRRHENPIGILLRKFGQEPLGKLLELIGLAGRVDVLLSLLPFAQQLAHHKQQQQKALRQQPGNNQQHQIDSGLTAAFVSSTSSSTVPSHSTSSSLFAHSSSPPSGPFLLLLHHELAHNRDLRRFHRMLVKNLERYAEEEGIKVLDVDMCMRENDLLGSVQQHFDKAWQVLLALSPDYAHAIAGQQMKRGNEAVGDEGQQPRTMDQRVQLKRTLHQMTFQEVLYNRGENRRFRVILMRGTHPVHVPRGWPSNTLHYHFPEDFTELCQRLFDGTMEHQEQGEEQQQQRRPMKQQ